MTNEETPVVKKRWPFSWGRAEWIPLGLLVLCVLGNSITTITHDLDFTPLWFVILIELLSGVWYCGNAIIPIWICLSSKPHLERIYQGIFAYLFVSSNWFAMGALQVLMVSTLTIIFSCTLLSLIRSRLGWYMKCPTKACLYSHRFIFSIKDLLVMMTLISLWLAFIQLLRYQTIPISDSSLDSINLKTLSLHLLQLILITLVQQLLIIVAMMDCGRIVKRSVIIILLASPMRILFFLYYGFDEPDFLLWAYRSQVMMLVGTLIVGLALRWAGYRIQKTPVTHAIAE